VIGCLHPNRSITSIYIVTLPLIAKDNSTISHEAALGWPEIGSADPFGIFYREIALVLELVVDRVVPEMTIRN
jgi:hypothetical protein